MLRFVPIIGLESLFVLWLGVGETAKISMITLGVMFPIYINTFAAIRSIDPSYGELADVVGLEPVGAHPAHRPAGRAARASSSACAWPWRSPGCCSCSPSRSTRRAGSAT